MAGTVPTLTVLGTRSNPGCLDRLRRKRTPEQMAEDALLRRIATERGVRL
jgi:hypothetical protein